MKKQWTKAHDRLLRRNYKKKSGKDLAWMLMQPLWNVVTRARELGLKLDQSPDREPDKKTAAKTEVGKAAPESGRISEQTPARKPHPEKTQSIKKGSRLWTAQEDQLLRKYYNKKPFKDLSQMLERSIYSMTERAGKLGLRKKKPWWSSGEILFLKQHYPTEGAPYVADALQRSLASVHGKAKGLGLSVSGRIRWNPEADAYVKKWYGKKDTSEIAKKLGTSDQGVVNRAWIIGATEKVFRPWSQKEIDYALAAFPNATHKEVGQALGRTAIAVTGFYAKQKVRKFKAHKWTMKEKLLMRRLHSKLSIKELAPRLHQSEQRVRALAYRMGYGPTKKASPRYTDAERSFIVQNYQTMTRRQIAEKLNRPLSGIADLAGRLGVVKQKKEL
jgi:hypothetical protein